MFDDLFAICGGTLLLGVVFFLCVCLFFVLDQDLFCVGGL